MALYYVDELAADLWASLDAALDKTTDPATVACTVNPDTTREFKVGDFVVFNDEAKDPDNSGRRSFECAQIVGPGNEGDVVPSGNFQCQRAYPGVPAGQATFGTLRCAHLSGVRFYKLDFKIFTFSVKKGFFRTPGLPARVETKLPSACVVAALVGVANHFGFTASTATPIIQQQIAGLVDGGTYTFYVWAKVVSGTRKVSLAIVNNAYASYLAGPTQVTLTTAWQRFKITGTLASGQTGLWIVVRQYDSNGDDWTTGSIYLWGACLQQGNDARIGYARTWASQTANVAAGIASGAVVISAKDNAESPLRIFGPGSNLADHTLLEVTAGGELIIAGGTGNGYRLADLGSASNPSGWAGVVKVKNPAGTTIGYILLYTNP